MTVKKMKDENKRISLFDIIKDETLHARAETNNEVVMALTNVVTAGEELPPVVVFYDEEHYWLADGFLRYEAHILAGRGTIPAIIFHGGRKEALFHALKSNVNHGLRRSNADKRKAVEIALTDPEMQGLSDNEIAKICMVSQPFVSKIRRILTQNGYKFETTRVCSDGRIMDVSGIGAKEDTEPVTVEQEAPEVGDNNDEVTESSDPEDLKFETNKDPCQEDNVDTNPEDNNPGEETQDDVDTPPETELENGDQDLEDNLEADDTDDSETTEDDPDPVVDEDDLEGAVDTDTEGDASGDDNTDIEAQDLNLDGSEGDEVNDFDTDDTTDPEITEDNLPTDDDDDETDIDETDESTDFDTDDDIEPETAEDELEPETHGDSSDTDEDHEEDTGDDNSDTSDLDGIDPDALKLRVIQLQGLAKKQEGELKVKDNEIIDLKQQVDKLEADNLYLKRELHARSDAESEANAFLDINEMDEEDIYSMA